ncbi:MAG: DUF302 domain-containing protein [Chloroflexota bacterium]
MEPFAFEVLLDEGYDEAVDRVTAALKDEGFGVITRIDVKATIKDRLGEDFRPYVILGACNPPLAHRALLSEPTVGVMLPCNVTVEQCGTGSRVLIANPVSMMSVADLFENPALRAVADEAATRLRRVADALR